MTSLATKRDSSSTATLDDVACAVMRTSADGTFLRVNRTFGDWAGYPAEALVGRRRFQDLLTVGGRIYHQTHWHPLLQMQGSVSEVKLELLTASGATLPIVVNAVRRVHEGVTVDDLAAFVARDRDTYERELVDARRRLEELFAEATRLQREASDRALFAEQMVGIVSHDLRNPLSGIKMGVSLLARDDLSASQRVTLSRITRAADRANHLIADLLDFTQARVGGGIPVSRRWIDLHDAVFDAVEELASVHPGRALLHARQGAGACFADPHRLAQLVGNLVSNAMAYGERRSPVTVTSSVEASSFSIAVHNAGKPISSEAQARLFDPMTRGQEAPTEVRSVGLGLYIVREIARAHGGSAQVRSSADAGTTFSAVFPRGAQIDDEAPSALRVESP